MHRLQHPVTSAQPAAQRKEAIKSSSAAPLCISQLGSLAGDLSGTRAAWARPHLWAVDSRQTSALPAQRVGRRANRCTLIHVCLHMHVCTPVYVASDTFGHMKLPAACLLIQVCSFLRACVLVYVGVYMRGVLIQTSPVCRISTHLSHAYM